MSNPFGLTKRWIGPDEVIILRAQHEALMAALPRAKARIDVRLNDIVCEMKPDYDDSITGFNEAWDIVRAIFKEELATLRAAGVLEGE